MQQVVSITSQGQLTIPKSLRNFFGIKARTKAVLRVSGRRIIVEPKNDFWSLSGSMKSKLELTDKQLRRARDTFGKKWPRKAS